tara:strand:+ start:2151 stop:2555 length:405 start_codon:yes stop_codon:yes gene_type:complete
MSDWDTEEKNQSSPLADIAEEYRVLVERKEQIESRMTVLSDKILSEFIETSGEQSLAVSNKLTIHINRPERWTWDSEIIADLYPSDGDSPPHITKKMSVDKRKFQGLEDEEKRILLPALTRKPGSAKISITEGN